MLIYKSMAALLLGSLLCFTAAAEELLQPFVHAYTAQGTLDAEVDKVRASLKDKQFTILGEYRPFEGAHVIAVTTPEMTGAGAGSEFGGFGAANHVALTAVDDGVQVSYINPPYMAAAYRLPEPPPQTARHLAEALGAKAAYGTAAGRSAEALKGYHYMMGMEYFPDVYELATYKSHEQAVAAVEKGLAEKAGGAEKVYRLDIPGAEQVLFGVSRANVGDKRAHDAHILRDTIDAEAALKTTPYLPYQMLVVGDEVVALHMRFRAAVFHPDLTMGTFGKLISSPGAIEDLLRKVAGGKSKKKFGF